MCCGRLITLPASPFCILDLDLAMVGHPPFLRIVKRMHIALLQTPRSPYAAPRSSMRRAIEPE